MNSYKVRYFIKTIKECTVKAENRFGAMEAAIETGCEVHDYVELHGVSRNGAPEELIRAECVYCGRPIMPGEPVIRDRNDDPNCSEDCANNVRLLEGYQYRDRLRGQVV